MSDVVRYIGARYVPIYVGEWDSTISYEPLSIVTDNIGNSFTSRKTVPAGTALVDGEYWAQTGVFNAQLEHVQEQVEELEKKASVSYEQFGAVLDGVTDDSVAVLAAHAYANSTGAKIEQHKGTLLLNFTVDVKTDCDFTGMTFIMNNETPITCYHLVHDDMNYPTKTLTLGRENDVYDSDLYGKFCVPYLASADTLIGVRGAGSGGEYYHRQPLALDNLGDRITAPYYLDSVTGAFVLRGYSSLMEKGVTFRGGYLLCNTSAYRGFKRFVHVERNNCTVSDITIGYSVFPTEASVNTDAGCITVYRCCNTVVEKIRALNHSESNSVSDPYVLILYECFNTCVKDCMITQGWGAIANDYIDTVNVENCVCNRFDTHYGSFGNIHVSGCYFNGSSGRINIGYGRGSVFIDSCSSAVAEDYFTNFRSDLPVIFDGTINISNCDLTNYGWAATGGANYSGGSPVNPNITLGEIIINISNTKLNGVVYGKRHTSYVWKLNLSNCTIGGDRVFTKADVKTAHVNMVGCIFTNNIQAIRERSLLFNSCTFYGNIEVVSDNSVFTSCCFKGSTDTTHTINGVVDGESANSIDICGSYFDRTWLLTGYNLYVYSCLFHHTGSSGTYTNQGGADYNRNYTQTQAA